MLDQAGVAPRFSIAVLGVSPIPADQRVLRSICASSKWNWNGVATLERARLWMTRRGLPAVIICERDLPDGNWKLLFQETQALAHPPKFVVSSRLADEYLWVEVLNLGGHDVLAIPFSDREVFHVVRSAAESWLGRWGTNLQRQKAYGAGGGAIH